MDALRPVPQDRHNCIPTPERGDDNPVLSHYLTTNGLDCCRSNLEME